MSVAEWLVLVRVACWACERALIAATRTAAVWAALTVVWRDCDEAASWVERRVDEKGYPMGCSKVATMEGLSAADWVGLVAAELVGATGGRKVFYSAEGKVAKRVLTWAVGLVA